MTIEKPLLAGKVEDVEKLRYPVIASPKLDGIRCLIIDGRAVSRKLLPIPNRHISRMLASVGKLIEGFDGELMVTGDFGDVSSAIMSQDGEPKFRYIVFDVWSGLSYESRIKSLIDNKDLFPSFIEIIPCEVIRNAKQLLEYEEDCLDAGYEGVMVRRPDGKYKQGRSTTNEQILLKLKRFNDDEAIIIGANEKMHNGNEATVDELGHTKRSHHAAGKSGTNTLGAFRVRGLTGALKGVNFKIGTGFTDAQRKIYWKGKDAILKKIVKFKYQEIGSDGKPRFPVFLSFRDERDMS